MSRTKEELRKSMCVAIDGLLEHVVCNGDGVITSPIQFVWWLEHETDYYPGEPIRYRVIGGSMYLSVRVREEA